MTETNNLLGNSQWKSNIILVIKKILKLVHQEESSSLVVDYYCFEACVLSPMTDYMYAKETCSQSHNIISIRTMKKLNGYSMDI